MTGQKVVAKTVWIPVHPEFGPDWSALTDEEDRPNSALAKGYSWKRFVIKSDED